MMSSVVTPSISINRRKFIGLGAGALAVAGLGLARWERTAESESVTRIRVPPGFIPRIIARSGERVMAESFYRWHASPDGGGCFAAQDGGWIYVSNSELTPGGAVSALCFAADGRIVDAYSILAGARHNCSGCETPWNTWLSCEEHSRGIVWECDPFGNKRALARPAMGLFKHESAIVDPASAQIYMTEDRRDGGLYRFTPARHALTAAPDLAQGVLEIAELRDDKISWSGIADPSASSMPLRHQVEASARFNGGEGIDMFGRNLRFTTKGDGRIWQLNLLTGQLEVLHRVDSGGSEVDDITHTARGDIVVAREGSPLRIQAFPVGAEQAMTLVELPEHLDSEITGLTFDPAGKRLYFSSQRGNTGQGENGISLEVQGDFRQLSEISTLVEWRLEHERI